MIKIIKKVIFGLFLLISFGYLFIVVSPMIFKDFYPFGIRVAIVQTGSMEPTLKVNDFVIVKKPNKIKVNDIISYKDKGNKREVLHRVIKVNNDKIVTKGDANNTEDNPIERNQVVGVLIRKSSLFGNIINFCKKPIVFSITITLLVIMMLIPTKDKKN